jgi:hypothetical protein
MMTMIRALVMTVIAAGAFSSVASAAEEGANDASARASTLARQTLAKSLKVAEDAIEVTGVEPRTWNDSSLDCGKPGMASLQVITEGYAVALSSKGRTYAVHVAGNSAVVCDRLQAAAGEARKGVRAAGIEQAVRNSRADLAQRLHADVKDVRLVNVRPQRWPDSALGCPRENESVTPGEVSGFRVELSLNGRVFTYHADGQSTRPCPAIEAE